MQLDLHPYAGTSFSDYVRQCRPEVLPHYGVSVASRDAVRHLERSVPVGTTILALKYEDGVVVAGDRRATEGSQIASHRMEKVYAADARSVIAIAGTAGPCIELVKLFKTELEHYEKLEGDELSYEGKANKLAQMVREQFPLVFDGLVVIPIFAGYDLRQGQGRICQYDITGGRYEEIEFCAVGSGGKDAQNTMKEHYRRSLAEIEAINLILSALLSAAEEDVGTGGPDFVRGIYPIMKLVREDGVVDIGDDRVAAMCLELVEAKKRRHDAV